MNITNSVNLVEGIIDEVALEGLDGITLEALWQRLSIRFEELLPLKNSFMDQIWKICLEIIDFTFYELQNPRDKLVIFDRYELEYLNSDYDKDFDRDIYLHYPIEDTKLNIKGSCSTYYTRKNISQAIKNLTLPEAIENFGQKLVIVASQILRERALMTDNVSPILQLSLMHYCLLERIGRARKLGEITIKRNSQIKEDAKTLFYIRKGLQDHGLIRKQVYYQGNTGTPYSGQNTGSLVHLTRFFNTRKPKVIMWAEHLINYLKSKENYVAEYNEVKNELNLDYSIKKFFKINMLQKVFRTDLKVPYRSYFPNSVEKEWQVKNNSSKERVVKLVTLTDANIEISDLWRTTEVKEYDDHYQINIKNQKINIPFLKQIYTVVESKESKGASQTELAKEMGLTKLISRTLVRNLVKSNIVSTYLDDIGRQRTTKYVSKKFDGKSSLKKQFDEEISKMKEYSRSVQIEKDKGNISDNKFKENSIHNVHETNSEKELSNETIILRKEDMGKINCKELKLAKVNKILKKYKLFKNQTRYKCTLSKNQNRILNFKNLVTDASFKKRTKNILKYVSNKKSENIIDSDFYRTIETKLIIQKPECKKSSKIAVSGFLENVANSESSQNKRVSYRLLRRANLIIESVKEHKIIEDTQKLMKFIHAEEDKEGLEVKLDKNSLIRLLQKLANDNFIKYIKLILKNRKQTKQKVVNFICDPNIDINDSVIQSAVEQAKLKFCIMQNNSQKINESIGKITSNNINNNNARIPSNLQRIEKEKVVICRNNALGRKYGYSPKFIRMKTMHIFLYHLIYDHIELCIPKGKFLEKIKSEKSLFDDILNDDLKIYSNEINWKMFIPPLPKHRGYPSGWALMCDVLLRMPLSIFVKVHNVNYEVPGLQALLDHPIKRHILVKDVSTTIRNLLFLKRKYMFSIHEIVSRLCYIGLVQFGPQMLKEKDQVFIYLNQRTELLDTTSSAAGYHKIEDKPYPVTKFTFTSMAVVENYWYEMWNTCINTCLGGRSVVEGKDILLEDLSRKAEMIQSLKVRLPDEASKYDVGFVPGDRKGAAGIDSAFFPHLKRNWNWVTTVQKDLQTKTLQYIFSTKPTKPNSKSLNTQPHKISGQLKKRSHLKLIQLKIVNSSDKSIDSSKPMMKIKREKAEGHTDFPVAMCSKPPKIIRKVLPRKSKFRKRVKYDEIDYSALQRMDKLRVDWEQHEDNILLVCKVAMVYLCPNPRRNLVTFTAIRDILRSYSFSSYNKTSRACQRRLLYMLKQPKTINSVLLGVEEVKQDYFVTKRFGGFVDCPRGESENQVEYEKRMEKVFKDLVTYIAKKYYNIADMEQREPIILPKTIQEFNIFHNLKLPTKIITSPGISKEVCEVNDIHTATINSVIHSSMCCGKERRSWAYQLFKVYQQYPEYLLRSAMLKIRADQMVTMKKNYMCAYKKFGNCMPMSSSQYQLSSAYYYKFQTKWPYEIFSESYGSLLSLLENYDNEINTITKCGIEVKPTSGGIVAAINELINSNNIDIDIEIPEQIIMLDPGLTEKDEVYQRIALRYQAVLKGLNSENTVQLQDSVSNNVQSDDIFSNKKINNIEQISINNDQKNFFQIRSKKRSLDNELCDSFTKKQKLDNEENKFEVGKETQNIIREIKNINEENKSAIKNDKITLVTNNNEVNDVTIENTQTVQYQQMETDCPIDQIDSNSCIDIYKISSSVDSNYNKENISSLITNDSNSVHTLVQNCSLTMQSFSYESRNKDCIEKKNENIKTNFTPSVKSLKNNKQTSEKNSSSAKPTLIRVNELVKQVRNVNTMEEIEPRIDIHDVRTRQTRIAMLKMREELHDLTFHDSHHAHEYFVVNSFKLFCSLMINEEDKQDTVVYRGMKLPKQLLPADIEVVNKVLDDIKKFAIFPKNPISYEDLKKEILEKQEYNWEDVNVVCKFIKAKIEYGATLHELTSNFNHFTMKLANILDLLLEKRIVLRAGIITVRFIYNRYINPWIIHSYKILRLEKEAHQVVPEGSVYVLDSEENIVDKEKETKRVTTAANLFYNSSFDSSSPNPQKESPKESSVTNDNVDENPRNEKRLRRNRTLLLKQKDIYRAAELLDFNTAEEIKVVIKPWIRIDGVLNRRVLDRMLGAVLCYCIERPGISLTIIQNRFTPAIQPYHIRELIEILIKLGCIKTTVQRITKCTLFSKPSKLDISENSDLAADSDSIIIEPTIQATLKFGMFLSNRAYNSDFLSPL